ncbi:MAG: transcription antitermination factor NusB [Treponema sp.]|nr:transcription antitermination factor NusB [Treponema sp.]
MSRRNGRIIAFQALYSWDVTKVPLEDLLSFSWLEKDSELHSEEEKELTDTAKDERTFATLIISGTIEHIEQIDEVIKEHLSANWSMERINKVALAILRVSIYELLYQPDAQIGIIIDEAVKISKNYGTDDSYKFINAVLDNVGKKEKGAK